jgi:hypothetical protein
VAEEQEFLLGSFRWFFFGIVVKIFKGFNKGKQILVEGL